MSINFLCGNVINLILPVVSQFDVVPAIGGHHQFPFILRNNWKRSIVNTLSAREKIEINSIIFKLTSGGIHCAAIANNQATPRTAFAQLEESVLYLYHRAQEIFLKFECCNTRVRENTTLHNEHNENSHLS